MSESFVCSVVDLILKLVLQSPPVACVTYVTYSGSNQGFDCRHDKDEERREEAEEPRKNAS